MARLLLDLPCGDLSPNHRNSLKSCVCRTARCFNGWRNILSTFNLALGGNKLQMLIRLGYDIVFDVPVPVPVLALLNVHPSRRNDLRELDVLTVQPETTL